MIPADVALPDGTIVRVVDNGTGDKLAGKLMAVVSTGEAVHLVAPPECYEGYLLNRLGKAATYLSGVSLWITDEVTMRRLCEAVSAPTEKP